MALSHPTVTQPSFSFYISLVEDPGRTRRKLSSIKYLLGVRHCTRHYA